MQHTMGVDVVEPVVSNTTTTILIRVWSHQQRYYATNADFTGFLGSEQRSVNYHETLGSQDSMEEQRVMDTAALEGNMADYFRTEAVLVRQRALCQLCQDRGSAI